MGKNYCLKNQVLFEPKQADLGIKVGKSNDSHGLISSKIDKKQSYYFSTQRQIAAIPHLFFLKHNCYFFLTHSHIAF